jgi:DNA-binding SARP family transcriptional activator
LPEPLRIRLSGGFQVSIGTRSVPEESWRLKRAASLVKLLALAEGLHREQVMEWLWPALAPDAASNNLRQALHAARRALEPDPSAASRYLRVRDGWLALSSGGPLWVDAEVFERAARTARSTEDPAAYLAALNLYAGELLPEDRYEAWAEQKRESLRQIYIALLMELATLTISEHTAATHVRRILKKLNIRSRTQVADWVRDRNPLP